MNLTDMCGLEVCSVSPEATVQEAALRMKEEEVGSLVVIQGERPAGFLTDRDLALRVLAEGRSPDTPVHEVMSQPVHTVPAEAGIVEPLQLMRDKQIRRLPLVDGEGKLCGILSLDDYMMLLGKAGSLAGDIVRSGSPS
jgi:CBS domain-containing protein